MWGVAGKGKLNRDCEMSGEDSIDLPHASAAIHPGAGMDGRGNVSFSFTPNQVE